MNLSDSVQVLRGVGSKRSEILEKMNVFTAQSNVGVIPCKNLDEAKTICAQVEKNVLAHVPKEA